MKKTKYLLIGFLVLFTVFTTLNPIYPQDQLLQHIGTFLLLIVLIKDTSTSQYWLGFIGVCSFTVLHIIGARYVYSNVPYQEWLDTIFNIKIGDDRNHFDRFVHLSFGVLFFPYIFQIISKWNLPSYFKTIFIAWMVIQTMSLGYELFEWGLTRMASPEDAETYNGQQGDMWDAQKDMALALLGSSIVSLAYFIKSIYKKPIQH
jgi:putative membrane protein